jgi:hypothetical protein
MRRWAGLHCDAPFVHRLRGGRRTMRDEDEEDMSEVDEESDVDEDEDDDDEYDDDTENSASSAGESDSAVDEEEDGTDDEELLPESPRRSKKKASTRDELPQAVVRGGLSDMEGEGAMTSARLAPGQLLEQRDGTEAAGPSILCLDVASHISDQTKALHSMRVEGVLTDVHLACKGGAKLAAHRVVLAAASPQLRGMVQNLGAASATAEQVESETCSHLSLSLTDGYHM